MIPSDTYTDRMLKIKDWMHESGIDGVFLLKPQNVYYLTGFNPIIQSHKVAVFLPIQGEASLILHALRIPHAEKEAVLKNFIPYGRWGRFGANAPSDMFGALESCVGRAFAPKPKKLGIEASYLPLAFFRRLESFLPHTDFADLDGLLKEMRCIKTAEEIDLIAKAAVVADVGMAAAISAAVPGATEIEVSVRAMKAMQAVWEKKFPDLEAVDFGTREGGVLNSLWAYCLSGARMNLGCDSPKDRRIEDGDLVWVVIWTALNGYHAENERTIAVGRIQEKQEHAFQTVLQARQAASEMIRPGNSLSDIYRAAADVMTRGGFGAVLPGRVGHGLGLGAHESPSLGPTDTKLIEDKMVLSFEPGIRIGELGGAQHSDTIVITPQGFRYLTKTERGLIVAGA